MSLQCPILSFQAWSLHPWDVTCYQVLSLQTTEHLIVPQTLWTVHCLPIPRSRHSALPRPAPTTKRMCLISKSWAHLLRRYLLPPKPNPSDLVCTCINVLTGTYVRVCEHTYLKSERAQKILTNEYIYFSLSSQCPRDSVESLPGEGRRWGNPRGPRAPPNPTLCTSSWPTDSCIAFCRKHEFEESMLHF